MKKILITGGAGFIGSNLTEHFLNKGYFVRCLDNFSTGFRHNIEPFLKHPNYEIVQGDIRSLDVCKNAVDNIDFVLHQAALGSVPRSVNDPITSNEVNVTGFLNMLVAARDAKIKRIVYAGSSSTYGDSETLPKKENKIGKPLSPYAITKYANELYADVFIKTYGMEIIGLRYFNVFGRRQNTRGAYAAVIPLFTKLLINHQSPIINGTGENSRDFTYIDNVIQMNELAMLTNNKEAINTVYNTAAGERTSLNILVNYIKEYLILYDPQIASIEVKYGPERVGDIPHSLASIEKAKTLLGYQPTHEIREGLQEAVKWYWEQKELL
jgi:UDP-N-acetylglucosamine 4-epimerase